MLFSPFQRKQLRIAFWLASFRGLGFFLGTLKV
jgi:hypothetical protein